VSPTPTLIFYLHKKYHSPQYRQKGVRRAHFERWIWRRLRVDFVLAVEEKREERRGDEKKKELLSFPVYS
jgi:hypothetical protein